MTSNTASRQINVPHRVLPNRNFIDSFALRVLTTENMPTVYLKKVTHDVRPYGESLDDYIEKLKKLSEGLVNVTIDSSAWDDYGSATCEVLVEGWTSNVTAAEIEEALKAEKVLEDEQVAIRKRRAERELEQIKKEFPDLLS